MESIGRYCCCVFGLVLFAALPGLSQTYISVALNTALKDVQSSNPGRVSDGVRVLKRLYWVTDLDELVLAYSRTKGTEEKEQLATIYSQITGEDIEDRLDILFD